MKTYTAAEVHEMLQEVLDNLHRLRIDWDGLEALKDSPLVTWEDVCCEVEDKKALVRNWEWGTNEQL